MTHPPRPCLTCGTPTNGTRCPRCEAEKQSKRNASRTHYQGEYRRDQAAVMDAWIASNGYVCGGAPEMDHAPHPSHDLTVDHVVARSTSAGYRVLCREWNSRKGAGERRQ